MAKTTMKDRIAKQLEATLDERQRLAAQIKELTAAKALVDDALMKLVEANDGEAMSSRWVATRVAPERTAVDLKTLKAELAERKVRPSIIRDAFEAATTVTQAKAYVRVTVRRDGE